MASFGLSQETTRGTAVAAVDTFVRHTNLELNDKVEKVTDESSIGVLVDATDDNIVAQMVEGNVETLVGDRTTGYFLKSLLGTSAKGAVDEGTYTHTFSLDNDTDHRTLTLYAEDPNQGYAYPGCVITTYELTANMGDYVMQNVGFMGKKGIAATLTAAYTAENTFLPQHMDVKIGETANAINTNVSLQSLTLNVDKGVQTVHSLGSVDPADFLNGNIAVTGTMEMFYNDTSFHTLMTTDASRFMQVTIESDTVIGTATGANAKHPKMVITLDKVKFNSFTKQYEKNGIVKASVEFKAFYNTSTSKLMEIDLTNTTSASY